MHIVVAGRDPTALEEYLKEQGHKVRSIYVNDVCLDAVKAFNPDILIYSDDVIATIPHEEALKQIQGYQQGCRVIFFGYRENNPVILCAAALGIKDFVFKPNDFTAILDRIEKPASNNTAAEVLKDSSPSNIKMNVENVPERPHKNPFGLHSKMPVKNKEMSEENSKEKEVLPQTNTQNLPVPIKKKKKVSISIAPLINLFRGFNLKKAINTASGKNGPAGIIVEGKYVKGNWANSVQMLDSLLPLDGVVIPREWGINAVKDIKRDPRSRTVPIIVLKGNKEWLAVGADKYVRKINSSVIKDTTALAKRLRELWQMEETDSLTGLYSRKFFNIWLTEQTKQSKTFSLVMIDIDKFKNVNDTYGHPAGDTVLATFGSFLKSEVRNNDFVARYGGEEFIIGLPGLTAGQGHIIIDRLRERWSERVINVSDGRSIKSTFSAGVADSYSGSNILEAADQMLYKAKENGRNQVKTDTANSADKVLIMGQIPSARFVQCNIDITFDPQEAFATVCDVSNIRYAPADKILYVLGTNSVIDWAAKQNRPEAIICSSIEEIIKELTGEENLNDSKTVTVQESIKPVQIPDNRSENKVSVLPGARSTSEGQTIPVHGVLYVVCPSRPGQAGEMAAKLCNILKNAALLCAASESTAALSIGIPVEQLIVSDWRIPGAEAPVKWAGTTVWPVDPYKHINITTVDAMHNLVDQIQSLFPLTIVDCGGSLDICSRVALNEGVLVLYHEGDSADVATAHWIKTYGGRNVKVMSPSEVPDIIEVDNGFIISHGAVGYIRNNI